MKYLILLVGVSLFLLQGCDLREREETLQKREAALNEKEQELLLKEKKLQLKEEELKRMEQRIDSTVVTDTAAMFNPILVGNWNVKMTCTETTCPGSAVGDTKTETWEISYQDKNVIAKAKVNEELVRVYSGIYTGNTLELVESMENTTPQTTRIIARLRIVNDTQLEGHREIERINENCKIVYTLLMEKK